MSDLTRTVLRTLTSARRVPGDRPDLALAGAGFLAASLTVVAGGQVGAVRSVIPLTTWLGLLSRAGQGRGTALAASLSVAGIVLLAALWLVAIRLLHREGTTDRQVWLIAGAWATPFVIGPPLLSNDVFSYAAQGLLLRGGLDPYTVGPASLGPGRALSAVDPIWRSVPSPYGPVASTLQHLAIAISGGNPLGATVVFRVIGLLSLIAIGVLAAELAAPRRVPALTLTVLNPLLLLHVVSGAHLDGVMCALLLAAVVLAYQRHWELSLVLATVAGSVKAPAFAAVLAIIAVHVQGLRGRAAWLVGARDTAVAAASTVLLSLLVPDGWGWVNALNTPSLGHTDIAPASIVSSMLKPVVPGASFDDLAAGGRIAALLAAGCIVVYLTVTARHRALDRTAGYGLLAVGVLGPVVYPWYLLGAVTCLAPTARAALRDTVVLLSIVGCLVSPPGLPTPVSTTLTLGSAAVGVALLAGRARHRARLAVAHRRLQPNLSAGG